MGRAYTMGDTGYADIVIDELINDAENNDCIRCIDHR